MTLKLRAILVTLLLGACGGNDAYYKSEEFLGNTGHWQEYAVRAGEACRVASRILLREGYVIESPINASPSTTMIAVKEFKGDENEYGLLHVHVTCDDHSMGSRVFVTAIESKYETKTSRRSSAVGIPIVGPFTISKTSENETQIKTIGQTITDKQFYRRFFRALQQELGATLGPR